MIDLRKKSIQCQLGNITLYERIGFSQDIQVYKCMRKNDLSQYAIKLSKIKSDKRSTITHEPLIYSYIDNVKYKEVFISKMKSFGKYVKLPSFYGYGKIDKNEYIITTLFGQNLGFYKASSFSDLKEIALTVITTFQYIHSMGWVYADVKGANFVREINDKDGYAVIDLGGMERYDYDDVSNKKVLGFRGTYDYASLSAHSNLLLFPLDDFESFGYLIYKWIYGSLPWEKVNKHDHQTFIDKKLEFIETLTDVNIKRYFDIIISVDRNSPPDYNCLRELWL
jgi:serine/threonine protein kinase